MDAIVPEGFYELQAEDKNSVIREMIQSLVNTGYLNAAISEFVIESVLERERSGSTGIINGVAVPHTKHFVIPSLICAVGRSVKGVDFDSQDGQPIFVFFLILSAKTETQQHLEKLAEISRLLRNEDLVKSLRNARSIEEMRQLVLEIDG